MLILDINNHLSPPKHEKREKGHVTFLMLTMIELPL